VSQHSFTLRDVGIGDGVGVLVGVTVGVLVGVTVGVLVGVLVGVGDGLAGGATSHTITSASLQVSQSLYCGDDAPVCSVVVPVIPNHE
jgi:putative effector of murein hydrolase